VPVAGIVHVSGIALVSNIVIKIAFSINFVSIVVPLVVFAVPMVVLLAITASASVPPRSIFITFPKRVFRVCRTGLAVFCNHSFSLSKMLQG
jgi:hypothetical protein